MQTLYQSAGVNHAVARNNHREGTTRHNCSDCACRTISPRTFGNVPIGRGCSKWNMIRDLAEYCVPEFCLTTKVERNLKRYSRAVEILLDLRYRVVNNFRRNLSGRVIDFHWEVSQHRDYFNELHRIAETRSYDATRRCRYMKRTKPSVGPSEHRLYVDSRCLPIAYRLRG